MKKKILILAEQLRIGDIIHYNQEAQIVAQAPIMNDQVICFFVEKHKGFWPREISKKEQLTVTRTVPDKLPIYDVTMISADDVVKNRRDSGSIENLMLLLPKALLDLLAGMEQFNPDNHVYIKFVNGLISYTVERIEQ